MSDGTWKGYLLIRKFQANNISAAEIRDSYQQRVRQAEQDAGEAEDNGEGLVKRAKMSKKTCKQSPLQWQLNVPANVNAIKKRP
jgi:hypothetical protein